MNEASSNGKELAVSSKLDCVLDRPANASVGFSIAYGLSGAALERWKQEHDRTLAFFPWLRSKELNIGSSTVRFWSQFPPEDSLCESESGQRWLVAGSPTNQWSWRGIASLSPSAIDRIHLSLEGRWTLLQVDAQGEQWELLNDWAGAMPVFFAPFDQGGVVSSLESVVTRVAELGSRQFSKKGLVELLLLGHFLGADTLYEPMRVLPPDSRICWRQGRLNRETRLWSVRPAAPPDMDSERLLQRFREVTVNCITESLSNRGTTPVLITLSSGMDSRLIACVAAESGLPVEAYTYGPRGWTETYYGRRVAKSLGIPWERVPVGVEYLEKFTGAWLQWFGTSLHAHGMYQFPFLELIKGRGGLLPNGFYGNNMAGGGHPNDCLFQPGKGLLDRYCGYGTYWDRASLSQLLDFDPDPCFEEMEALLQEQVRSVKDWTEYQQMNCLDMWNRQARYTSYQPTMYSYYGLERSPFMNRDYARFCMSLPPELLRKRKLQIEMLKLYWPEQFGIGGSFAPRKGLDRKWHGLRYRIADKLPPALRALVGVTSVFRMGVDCVQHSRWDAFPCISRTLVDSTPLRAAPILEAMNCAIKGSKSALLRVLAVQPVIHALTGGTTCGVGNRSYVSC